MNTPACGSCPLLLPPSCQSVTSSANSSLSAKSTARASQILLLPFPSSSSHPPLHYLFVESENGIIMSWVSFAGFPWVGCHLSGHTPSGVSSQWVPSPGAVTYQAHGCLTLTPSQPPCPPNRLLLLASGVSPFCPHSPTVCFLPVA